MKPAARVTDMHECPAWETAYKPHLGGPIEPPCMPTVLTLTERQARIMDSATCLGPPDFIAQGSSTVSVGGLPASRQLDTTSHGGRIVTGGSTVLIGGPAVTMKVMSTGPFPLRPTPAFVKQLQDNLALIFDTRSGQEWLRQMAANGRTITFQ